MSRRNILIAMTVLALVSLACGISVQIPLKSFSTGPTVTEEIHIPAPATETIELALEFYAGNFELQGGAEDALVEGTARYNVEDLKPHVTSSDRRVSLRCGELRITGIPELSTEIINDWSMRLGNVPMELTIEAGAFEGDIDLGGVPVQQLTVNGGVSNVKLDFSAPNPAEMETFQYETAASDVSLSGLANAHFERMVFHSGIGSFTFDFSGELQRDAKVELEAGASDISIIVPPGRRARVTVTGGLADVDAFGGWERDSREYTLSGSGPLIDIHVEVSAGAVKLSTR